MLMFCGKHLNDFNVNDKLSDHDIKEDSVITMMMKCLMTSEMSNFVQLNKKRPVYNNSVKDVKSDKRMNAKNNLLTIFQNKSVFQLQS